MSEQPSSEQPHSHSNRVNNLRLEFEMAHDRQSPKPEDFSNVEEFIAARQAFDAATKAARKRGELTSFDDYLKNRPASAENSGEHADSFDLLINNNPQLKRMAMIAEGIRELDSRRTTVEELEHSQQKTDKLLELFDKFLESPEGKKLSAREQEELFGRIVDMTAEQTRRA